MNAVFKDRLFLPIYLIGLIAGIGVGRALDYDSLTMATFFTIFGAFLAWSSYQWLKRTEHENKVGYVAAKPNFQEIENTIFEIEVLQWTRARFQGVAGVSKFSDYWIMFVVPEHRLSIIETLPKYNLEYIGSGHNSFRSKIDSLEPNQFKAEDALFHLEEIGFRAKRETKAIPASS